MPPVFCALILVWSYMRTAENILRQEGRCTYYCLPLFYIKYFMYSSLKPSWRHYLHFIGGENQMSEKGKTEIHTEVDLSWSLILRSMTGGHPPLLPYLKNPQTQIIIRKSWSSVCRKSCLSTFSSYPSVPKQMGKGSSTPLVSGGALLLYGIIVI